MIREVLKMGDPRLLEKSRPVEAFGTPQLRELVADMHDTMAHLNGAGLAAPQIGVPLRVVIFGVTRNPRYPPRFKRLRYRGFDESGLAIDRTVEGFHARVVQHEYDHLDGILYPMRILDMSKFGFAEVLFPDQNLRDE